jgi:hypothetical protein
MVPLLVPSDQCQSCQLACKANSSSSSILPSSPAWRLILFLIAYVLTASCTQQHNVRTSVSLGTTPNINGGDKLLTPLSIVCCLLCEHQGAVGQTGPPVSPWADNPQQLKTAQKEHGALCRKQDGVQNHYVLPCSRKSTGAMQGQILGAWCKAHYLKGTVHGPALAYLAASRLIVGVESWSPCDAPAPGMQTTWGCVVVLRACVLVGWRSECTT